jgi:GNAT superfamily N-acetyltransferase
VSDTHLHFRAFQDGDEPAVLALFDLEYGRGSRSAEWFWAFRANPVGRMDLLLAFDDDRLVGELGAVPLRMTCGGTEFAATRLQNLVIHPDVRGRGVFREASRRLDALLRETGVDLVIGFPNARSFPIFQGPLGYLHVADLPTWTLRAQDITAATDSDVDIRIGPSAALDDADAVWLQRCAGSALATLRDPAYMNWRYHPSSGKSYRFVRAARHGDMVGLAVFKVYGPGDSVDLLEWAVPGDPPAVTAMLASLAESVGHGAVFSTWMHPGDPSREGLRAAGFAPSSRVTHLIARSLSDRAPACLADPDVWHLSMGDSDVY